MRVDTSGKTNDVALLWKSLPEAMKMQLICSLNIPRSRIKPKQNAVEFVDRKLQICKNGEFSAK